MRCSIFLTVVWPSSASGAIPSSRVMARGAGAPCPQPSPVSRASGCGPSSTIPWIAPCFWGCAGVVSGSRRWRSSSASRSIGSSQRGTWSRAKGAKIAGCTCRLRRWRVCNSGWPSSRGSEPPARCFGIANAARGPARSRRSQRSGSAMPRRRGFPPVAIASGIPLLPTAWSTGPRSSRFVTSGGIARSARANAMPRGRARQSPRSRGGRCRKSSSTATSEGAALRHLSYRLHSLFLEEKMLTHPPMEVRSMTVKPRPRGGHLPDDPR
mgnify:CR=1 FL=1